MSSIIKGLQEFENFRLDTDKKILWHADRVVNLSPKAVELLCVLLENKNKVVSKDELMRQVWRDTFVEESNLTLYIHELRKTFKKFDCRRDLIQTVPRRGYRFVGETTDVFEREEITIERHAFAQTLVEEVSDSEVKEGEKGRKGEGEKKALSSTFTLSTLHSFTLSFIAAVLLLVLGGGFLIWRWNQTNAEIELPDIKSIAVLPLKPIAAAESDEVLSLGLADALITSLGRSQKIVVRPVSSIAKYAESEYDALEVGRKLQTDAILDGSFQRADNRLRVRARLLRVSDGKQIWAGTFDEIETDVFKLQDAISMQAASSLSLNLTQTEQAQLSKRPTESAQAYEAYLKGRYFWNQRTPDSYFRAIRYFEEAVRFDPSFALAYSGLADSYVLLNRRYVASSEEALPKAEEAARKAVELDDALAEAHTSMGLVRGVYNRDWRESENHFRRAIELNPNYALAYGWYGMNLSAQSRFDEAEAQMRKAERLDPTSRNVAVYLAANFYLARQFDRAIEQSRKALELDPNISTAYWFLSQSFEQKKMYDQAVEADLERQKITAPQMVEPLREAFLESGIKGFWRKQIEIRREQVIKYSACTYEIATRYALLGENNKALKIIEDNFLYGGTCWNGLNAEPAFDSLRSEPRYQEVLRKMNFTD